MGWTWNNLKAEEVLAGYTKADSPLVCAQTSAGAWVGRGDMCADLFWMAPHKKECS